MGNSIGRVCGDGSGSSKSIVTVDQSSGHRVIGEQMSRMDKQREEIWNMLCVLDERLRPVSIDAGPQVADVSAKKEREDFPPGFGSLSVFLHNEIKNNQSVISCLGDIINRLQV